MNFAQTRQRAASTVVLVLWMVSWGGAAPPSPLPSDRDALFLGVGTCGSALCHGSSERWRNATVRMNEKAIWLAHDRHAGAFESLDSPVGQRIGTELGIGVSSSASQCLACHATSVSTANRGPGFRLEDGVACESCHGPGGAFLAAHVQATSSHAANVAAGMYPTDDPAARAALCLSCHQGDARRRVTHRMLAAGHPRLRFELDTYGARQPPHFRPDSDYRHRKPLASHLRLWAAGQIASARLLLDAAARERTANGAAAEFAIHECSGCHRPIGNELPRGPRPGLRVGAPTLIDAPLLLLRALAAIVDPPLATRVRDQTRALQLAAGGPAELARAVTPLRATLSSLETAIANRPERDGDVRAVVRALNAMVAEEQPLPFTAAEATAMSLSTLLLAEHEAGRLNAADWANVDRALDRVYEAVADERSYRPAALAGAVAELDRTLLR